MQLSVSMVARTLGYVPLEFYHNFWCKSKGDVNFFGLFLLENITRWQPTDKEDFGGTNLVGWLKMKVGEGKGREVFDVELVFKTENESGEVEEKEMDGFLEIVLTCIDDFPSKRPNMLQVVEMLRELRDGDLVEGGNC